MYYHKVIVGIVLSISIIFSWIWVVSTNNRRASGGGDSQKKMCLMQQQQPKLLRKHEVKFKPLDPTLDLNNAQVNPDSFKLDLIPKYPGPNLEPPSTSTDENDPLTIYNHDFINRAYPDGRWYIMDLEYPDTKIINIDKLKLITAPVFVECSVYKDESTNKRNFKISISNFSRSNLTAGSRSRFSIFEEGIQSKPLPKPFSVFMKVENKMFICAQKNFDGDTMMLWKVNYNANHPTEKLGSIQYSIWKYNDFGEPIESADLYTKCRLIPLTEENNWNLDVPSLQPDLVYTQLNTGYKWLGVYWIYGGDSYSPTTITINPTDYSVTNISDDTDEATIEPIKVCVSPDNNIFVIGSSGSVFYNANK